MVRSCSLRNCSNSVKQKYRFFVLPSVKKVPKRTAWLRKCGHLLPENLPVSGNSVSLCEGHFEPDQFIEYGPNVRTILKPTAVPSIFTRNPPRVCDAVEKKVKKVLESGITDESDVIASNMGIIDSTQDVDMIDAVDTNDNNQSSDASQLQTCVDPNLSQVQKELILLSNSINVKQNETSPVKLLRIKKSCMLVSTPVGNKIVPAAKKNIANLHQPLQPVLPSEYDENVESTMNDDSNISMINNEKLVLNTAAKPITRENLERLLGNNISQLNMEDFESLSESSQFPIENDCEDEELQPASNEDNMDSTKINTSSFVKSSNECQLDRVTNKISEKPITLNVTPVKLKPVQTSVTLQVTDKKITLLEPDAQLDEIFDSKLDENSLNHEIPPRPDDSDKNKSDDELEMIIRTAARGYDEDNNSAFFSPACTDIASLKKRVHELEVERDYAIRKYRRLALKMEVFYRNLKLFLNDDQIRILETEPNAINTLQWSKETLQRSTKIRNIIGSKGYEYLRIEEHFPLPSFRTLYRYKGKSNECTGNVIPKKINNIINKVVAHDTKDSILSDNEVTIEKEILPEHIKIEILDDEYFSESEYTNENASGTKIKICKVETISGMDEDE